MGERGRGEEVLLGLCWVGRGGLYGGNDSVVSHGCSPAVGVGGGGQGGGRKEAGWVFCFWGKVRGGRGGDGRWGVGERTEGEVSTCGKGW